MTDIILGLIALVAGLVFCFGGHLVMRLVFPVWGAFAGFAFGAGLVAGFAEEHFLGSVLGWGLGIVFAVIFAILSYLYYAVAVVLAMGAVGFALGAWLMTALGVGWDWVIVFVAVAVAVLVAVAAVAIDVPMILLVVLSAMGGAAVAVTGVMLMFGAVDSIDFDSAGVLTQVRDDWWWYVLYLVTAIGGVLTQSRSVTALRTSVRDQWTATPTRS